MRGALWEERTLVLAWTLLGTAAFVAGLGLVDVYAVSIGWWRTNGVVDYFHKQLGYDYHGTGEHPRVAGLPENFVYNVGGDRPFLRRLVSTFLSPLASSYLFVVALLVAAAAFRRRPAVLALSALAAAGLLWTFSRSALLAVAAGLLVLAALRRRPREVAAAVAVVAVVAVAAVVAAEVAVDPPDEVVAAVVGATDPPPDARAHAVIVPTSAGTPHDPAAAHPCRFFVGPTDGGDVLAMHHLLARHRGDIRSLLGRGGPGVGPSDPAASR